MNIMEYIPNQMNLLIFGVVLGCLNQVIFSLLLMAIVKKKKLNNSWLCWIPVANLWIIGKIINQFNIGKKQFDRAEYRLLTSSIVFLLVVRIPVIGMFVGVAYTILVISDPFPIN